MPIGRYFAFAGSLLLALLFFADWYLPKPAAEPSRREAYTAGIRIASTTKWPERVVFDTSLPTIVPPPPTSVEADAAVAHEPRDSFALLATPVVQRAPVVVRKAVRTSKRRSLDRVAAYPAAPTWSAVPAGW